MIFTGIFQTIYLIGLCVGIILYYILSRFIKVSNDTINQGNLKKYIFLRTLWMIYTGLAIIGLSTLFGFTGMAIAFVGLGVLTVCFVMLIIMIYKDKNSRE